MRAGDVAGDGEAEAGAALVLVAGLVKPDERPEHFLALLGRDARAVVIDVNLQEFRVAGAFEANAVGHGARH